VKLIRLTLKTLKRFLLLFAGISLLGACSESDIFWVSVPLMKTEFMIENIPFRADYIGTYFFRGEDLAKCGKGNSWEALLYTSISVANVIVMVLLFHISSLTLAIPYMYRFREKLLREDRIIILPM
jgi:hypothetical protein